MNDQPHLAMPIPVLITYHPSYLLRLLDSKEKSFWEDMLLKAVFGAQKAA